MKTLHFLLVPFFLLAQPEGFHLIQGDAKAPVIDSQGGMTIEAGKKAIVHWDRFSIGEKEMVRFVQPDSQSAILNRVTGFTESRIDGHLTANGKVFLINPNGVIVGPHGKIETSGFVGSTFDLLDADFLEGKEMLFQGSSKSALTNWGTIEAREGDVFLIGAKVANEGNILAPQGHVGIGCGKQILIQPEGCERVFIKVPLDESILDHKGAIIALHAELKSGGNPFEKAVKCTGKVETLELEHRGGDIYLVARPGNVELNGSILAYSETGKGGTVHILGDELDIQSSAHIDASGAFGGGTVLIGGDAHGDNPKVVNATNCTFAKGAFVKANALQEGDGGKVIVWSDNVTHFNGRIEALGAGSGLGGFVETSGKEYLGILTGKAESYSPSGKGGLWLMDPANVLIQTGGGSSVDTNCASNSFPTIAPSTFENSATDVTICATGNGSTICSCVNWPAIFINGTITMTTASLTFQCSGTIGFGSGIVDQCPSGCVISSTGPYSITVPSGKNLTFSAPSLDFTGGGSLSAPNGTVALSGNTVVVNTELDISAGTITLSSYSGGATSCNLTNNNVTNGTLSLSATKGVGINSPLAVLQDAGTAIPVIFVVSSPGVPLTFGSNVSNPAFSSGNNYVDLTLDVGTISTANASNTVQFDFTNHATTTGAGGYVTITNATAGSGQTLEFTKCESITVSGLGGSSSSSPNGTVTLEAASTLFNNGSITLSSLSMSNPLNTLTLTANDTSSSAGIYVSGSVSLLASSLTLHATTGGIQFSNAGDSLTLRADAASNGSVSVTNTTVTNNSNNAIAFYAGSSGTVTWTGAVSGTLSSISVPTGGTFSTNISTFNVGSWSVGSGVSTPLTGNLTISASSNISFGGTVSGAHNLSLTSSGGSVTVSTVNTNNITLQAGAGLSNTSLGSIPAGFLTLNGNLTATGGAISLNTTARTAFPSVATIIAPTGVGITTHTFDIGADEVFTALGSLSITATTATVTDLVSAGTLTLTVPSITATNRGSQNILTFQGSLFNSQNTQWVSYPYPVINGTVVSGSPVLNGLANTLSTSQFASDLKYGSYTLDFDPLSLPGFIPVPPPMPIIVVVATTALQNLLGGSTNPNSPLSNDNTSDQTPETHGFSDPSQHTPYNNDLRGTSTVCH